VSPTLPQTVPPALAPQLSSPDLWAQLLEADVIYVGEIHDRPAEHQAQLRLVQALHQANPQMVLGLEMFQRPFQSAIAAYLAQEITEAELQAQTEYADRWGYPWEFYGPLLRFAQQVGMPVAALNAPSEVTRRVARGGLAAITKADRPYVPDPATITTKDPAYRDWLRDIFREVHGEGHGEGHGGKGFNFEYFVAAQAVWDETMAAAIVELRQTHPDRPVIVLAGRGHVVPPGAIPSRVQRRSSQPLRQQALIYELPQATWQPVPVP